MRRWWMAGLLTILVPGLGQTYNGQIRKGAFFLFGLYAVYIPASIWFALRFPSFAMYLALASGFVTIVLVMVGDAILSARRIGDQFIPKFYNRVSVYLIVIIVFSLSSTALGDSIREYWIQAYKISSGSMAMEPALLPGDHIFIKKRPVSIHRGDIVVYEFPEDPSKDFIHRLIGLAGDIVEIRDKKLLINGRSIEEPYIRFSDGKSTDNTVQARDNMPAISVPEGMIFVLGDNRDRSYDSRFWGVVERGKVRGIARSIYFSWDRDNMRVRWSRIGMPPREYGTGTAP